MLHERAVSPTREPRVYISIINNVCAGEFPQYPIIRIFLYLCWGFSIAVIETLSCNHLSARKCITLQWNCVFKTMCIGRGCNLDLHVFLSKTFCKIHLLSPGTNEENKQTNLFFRTQQWRQGVIWTLYHNLAFKSQLHFTQKCLIILGRCISKVHTSYSPTSSYLSLPL